MRKIQALQMAALGLKKNGIQPLYKNCVPDFALAGSNTSMRIHSTLTGLDALLQQKYHKRVSCLSLAILRSFCHSYVRPPQQKFSSIKAPHIYSAILV
jgi:hypothetical protein